MDGHTHECERPSQSQLPRGWGWGWRCQALVKKQTSCSQSKRVPSSRFWGVPWILHFDPDPRAVLRQGFPGTFSETQVWWSIPQAQEGVQRRLALQKELRRWRVEELLQYAKGSPSYLRGAPCICHQPFSLPPCPPEVPRAGHRGKGLRSQAGRGPLNLGSDTDLRPLVLCVSRGPGEVSHGPLQLSIPRSG